MGAAKDTRYLERMKGGRWRVNVKVPADAYPVIGKRRLKEALGTDSLEEANRRKWAVVERFKAQIAAALGNAPDDAIDMLALSYREQWAAAPDDAPGPEYSPRDLVEMGIAAEAEALAGPPVGVDALGNPVHDPGREVRARRFAEIARGRLTPLRAPEASFRAQKGDNWEGKTWGKFDRIMGLLGPWLQQARGAAAVEVVDRKTAGEFVNAMMEAQGWQGATMNGYLSCLKQYWGWMEKRGYAPGNPWADQRVQKRRKRAAEGERPFTKAEMRKLLYGGTPEPYLADLMRIAALTGARLGAIVELRVGDCQGDVFTFPPMKQEPGARRVPVHPDLRGIVARRCSGKDPEAWLFPEVPPLGPTASPSARRGNKAGKAFARYAAKLGVRDEVAGARRSLVNFHSFRRWFVTEAERALTTGGAQGFTEVTIKEVVGHKVGDITFGTYKGAASDAQRRACVEAVRLPQPD